MSSVFPGDGLIAVDIGGTGIKAIAVDATGEVHRRIDIPTPRLRTDLFKSVGTVLDELRDALASAGHALGHLGVACPGLVDARAGIVRFASNLEWRDVELRGWLIDRFGVDASVENDARAGAIAEHAAAALGQGDDLAFIPIGTGVAAAFYVGGEVARGATNSAGEFGHIRAIVDGELCTCGNRGCVEVYTSAANILARHIRRGGRATSTPDIVESLGADPLAREVWDEAVGALAVGLATLVTLLDPSRIVIGGGLSRAGNALLVPLRERLGREISWRDVPPIAGSLLGSDSTLIGAALLGRDPGSAAAQGLARRLGAQLRDRESVGQP